MCDHSIHSLDSQLPTWHNHINMVRKYKLCKGICKRFTNYDKFKLSANNFNCFSFRNGILSYIKYNKFLIK